MTGPDNPIARRPVLKALAAVPILASSLTRWSRDTSQTTSQPHDTQAAMPPGPPTLAHQTLIGVL